MKRFSIALLLAALFAVSVAPAPASAGPKTCVPTRSKVIWHQYGVRVYYNKRGSVFACSNRYGKRIHLELAEFGETGAHWMFRTNGRYLFYNRRFVFAAGSGGSVGRLLDLKTRESTKHLGTRDWEPESIPECAPLEIFCTREAEGAAIGPNRSFVIGYRLHYKTGENKFVGEQFVIERHCFGPGLANREITQLDHVTSASDLTTIDTNRRGSAIWISGGVEKSAPFC